MSYDAIIACVQRHPHLYEPTHRNYKSRCQRLKTWERIADELGYKGKEEILRKRWKHLKDKYRKELKKVKNQNNGEIPKDCYSPWPIFHQLHFLKDDVQVRERKKDQRKEAMSEESASDRDTDSSVSIIPPQQPEANGQINVVNEEELKGPRISAVHGNLLGNQPWPPPQMMMMDPDLMFLMSLLPTMKSLTELQKLQFRGKINEMLLEAVTVNECNPHLYMQQQMRVFAENGTNDEHMT